MLHEEELMRTRDEDEGLRGDGDLEVDDGVEIRVRQSACLLAWQILLRCNAYARACAH